MKNFLFFVTVMSFIGCSSYTINSAVELTVDGEKKEGCFEWCADFLGLLGCDGSVVKSGDKVVKTKPAVEGKEGDELGAAHYAVDANGVATESDEACEVSEETEKKTEGEEKKAEDKEDGETTSSAEGAAADGSAGATAGTPAVAAGQTATTTPAVATGETAATEGAGTPN